MNRRARNWIAVMSIAFAAAAATGEQAPIDLRVDLSEAPRGIFHARLMMPGQENRKLLV